ILTPIISFAGNDRYNEDLATKNALKLAEILVPDSHPEFKPSQDADIRIIRSEKSGVVDFSFTSANGKFRMNIYCHLSQLLSYSQKYSNNNDVCFRLNIYEKDRSAINGFGKQVGIY